MVCGHGYVGRCKEDGLDVAQARVPAKLPRPLGGVGVGTEEVLTRLHDSQEEGDSCPLILIRFTYAAV